jgi:hypothetical protein
MGLAHPKYAAEPEIIAARKQLAIQSREALMVEWLPKHHVHENLNPDTGLGDDVGNSNLPLGGAALLHRAVLATLRSCVAWLACRVNSLRCSAAITRCLVHWYRWSPHADLLQRLSRAAASTRLANDRDATV